MTLHSILEFQAPTTSQEERTATEWSFGIADGMSLAIVRHATRDPREAQIEYLAPRVTQGSPDYIVEDSDLGISGWRSEWTDGVREIVTWITAHEGGVLIEFAQHSTSQGDALTTAREYLRRLRWRAAPPSADEPDAERQRSPCAPAPRPGFEFDWFIMDTKGDVAIVSTGGRGPVPRVVASHVRAHDRVGDQIPSRRIGSADVWLDYAEVGLFVYDWDHVGEYRRVAAPTEEIAATLVTEIRSIPELPLYPRPFAEDDVLRRIGRDPSQSG